MVCRRALQQAGPLIAQRKLRLSTEAISGVTVIAPPTHVEILVRNLVENAARYATPGGEVLLSLRESGESAVLTVFNECPPIPGWAPASLFEGFSRLDPSRTSATGGNGLGLAICGAIAKADGWAVALDHDGKGVLTTVTFRFCRASRGECEP